MSRNLTTAILLLGAALVIVLLVTANVRSCESATGPFGFLRFTTCTEEPLVQLPA